MNGDILKKTNQIVHDLSKKIRNVESSYIHTLPIARILSVKNCVQCWMYDDYLTICFLNKQRRHFVRLISQKRMHKDFKFKTFMRFYHFLMVPNMYLYCPT